MVLTAIESLAMIAFALSGLVAAARKRLDAVGVCVVAGVTFGLRAGAMVTGFTLPQWRAGGD